MKKAIGLILSGIILLGACKPEQIDVPSTETSVTNLTTKTGRDSTTTVPGTTATGSTTTTGPSATPGATATTDSTTASGTSATGTTTGLTTTQPAGINSLATIEQDMDMGGEALPYGMPTNYGWYRQGRVNTSIPGGNNPGGSPTIFPWYCLFPTGGLSQAVNTRVQIRNVYIYYLSKSKNTWVLATGSKAATGYYNPYNTLSNLTGITVNQRAEPAANGGGTSIKLLSGYCFQGWCAANMGPIDSTDVAGVWAYCEARLIVDDPSLADDRSKANLVLCQGGDYKTTSGIPTGDIAIGRFKRLTNGWRAFNMSTLTDAQWAKVPPPPVNNFD